MKNLLRVLLVVIVVALGVAMPVESQRVNNGSRYRRPDGPQWERQYVVPSGGQTLPTATPRPRPTPKADDDDKKSDDQPSRNFAQRRR